MTDPWNRPANQPPQVPGGDQPTQQLRQPSYPPPPPPNQPAGGPPPPAPATPSSRGTWFKRLFKDPLSITLVVVIVLALTLAGVVGAELIARNIADSVVAKATSCVVQDGVSVSFGARPFLLQHLTGHYSGIHITTDGNQLREAKGMKADIVIDDVRTSDSPNSAGTIGSLNATINWSADGIKQTIQTAIPLVGAFVSSVTTKPSDGTIELDGALGSIITQPEVVDGGIALKVVQLTGLGFTLPREAVQPALDAFSAQLTKNYPLNVRADSIQVTDSGVISKFSTQNATMPAGGQGDDACFAGI